MLQSLFEQLFQLLDPLLLLPLKLQQLLLPALLQLLLELFSPPQRWLLLLLLRLPDLCLLRFSSLMVTGSPTPPRLQSLEGSLLTLETKRLDPPW